MTAFFTDFAERNARTGRPSPTPLEIQRWEDDGGAVLPRRDAFEATTAAAPDNRCADPRVGRGRLKPKTRGNARSPAEGPPPSSALFVPAGDLGPEQQRSIKCRRGLFQSPPSTRTRLPVFRGAGCDRSWWRFSVFGPSAVAKRRHLAEIAKWDDYVLKDIGVSRQHALDKARKPFWRP
jgi:hypothetical protein